MSSIHRNLNYPDNQRGWVLVVGLVVLVMLTILSMALMKTTRLEEKMAGATWDMNLSFQAAETALRAAETTIESQTADWDGAEEIDNYVIEKLEKINDGDDTEPTVFRVTVRGTGGTNNRATLLRSHYAKVFGAVPEGPVGRLSWEQLFPD